MGQPYIRFFGTDWRSDPDLRLCSAASRGVWIDLISLMMESAEFGHLLVKHKVKQEVKHRSPTDEEIAVLTSTPVAVVREAIAELEEHGVFSRTEDGVIFSRRMVRDQQQSLEMQARGRRGGNPKLGGGDDKDKQELNHEDKPVLKPEDKPHSHSHSHISSVPSNEGTASPPPKPPEPPPDAVKDLFDRGVAILGSKRRSLIGKMRRDYGDLAVLAAIIACEDERPAVPVEFFVKALEHRRKRGEDGVRPFAAVGFG